MEFGNMTLSEAIEVLKRKGPWLPFTPAKE